MQKSIKFECDYCHLVKSSQPTGTVAFSWPFKVFYFLLCDIFLRTLISILEQYIAVILRFLHYVMLYFLSVF
jgi:hypothetical protein